MDDVALAKQTGGYINAAALSDIPGVAAAAASLLARVAALPFVPKEWLDTVLKAQQEHNGLWLPRGAIRADAWAQGKSAPLVDDIPTWLSNDASHAIAWNKLSDWWRATLQPILAGWARDQKTLMDEANNNAAFWDSLYKSVQPVAAVGNAILAAPEKVAGVASQVVTGTLKKLWPVLLVAAVGLVVVVVFKNKMMKASP